MLATLIFALTGSVSMAQPNSCMSASGSGLEAMAQPIREASAGNEKLCENIQALDQPAVPGAPPVCSAFWKQTSAAPAVPGYSEAVRNRPSQLDKSSRSFKNPTPNEMAARGRPLGNSEDEKSLNRLFNEIRTETAGKCCGNSQSCKAAFQAINLKFCSNLRAKTHPNEPDNCASADSAKFSLSETDIPLAWYNLNIARKNTPAAIAAMNLSATYPKLKGRWGQIGSGSVSISHYHHADSWETQYSLRHELGHGCSNVRRQLAAKTKSTLWLGYDFDSRTGNADCRVQSAQPYVFVIAKQLLAPEPGDALVKCLKDAIRSEMSNPADPAFMRNTCYNTKLEESFADVFALVTSESSSHNVLRVCKSNPSPSHVAGDKTVECLAKNSPNFRRKILGGPICAADSSQQNL